MFFFLLFPARRLFEEHVELLSLFEKLKELRTREEQATSEELAEHAIKVMETLDEGIRSLDELDVFFQYLHDVGATHTRIPGFKPEYFWVSLCLSHVIGFRFPCSVGSVAFRIDFGLRNVIATHENHKLGPW